MAGIPCFYFRIALIIGCGCLGSAKTLVNVAHKNHGGSCEASTEYNNVYRCINAIDGSTKDWAPEVAHRDNAWIKITFDGTYQIVKARLQSRSAQADRAREVELEFSNGTKYKHTMEDNSDMQTVPLPPVYASSVTVTIKSRQVNHQTAASGFGNIQLFGTFKDVHGTRADREAGVCAFPFTYGGSEYTSCTDTGQGHWCSYQDSLGTSDENWGYCQYPEPRFCHLITSADRSGCGPAGLDDQWNKGQGCCQTNGNWYRDRMPQKWCRAMKMSEKQECEIGGQVATAQCVLGDCCHQTLDPGGPSCYKALLPSRFCPLVTSKLECGSRLAEEACTKRGCCFDVSSNPQCFKNALECGSNRFWPHCTTCRCFDGVCDSQTGQCPSEVCQAGWKDDKKGCSTACGPNEYGQNCILRCNCSNSDGCDPASGPRSNCTCDDLHFNPPKCDKKKVAPTVLWFNGTKVNPSQAGNFTCVASGNPVPAKMDFTLLVPTGKTVTQHSWVNIEGTSHIVFQVNPVSPNDIFTCSVTTISKPVASKPFTVQTYILPELTQAPVINVTNATRVQVQWPPWKAGSDVGDPPIVAYFVVFKTHGSTEWTKYGTVLTSACASQCQSSVGNLTPYKKYQFAIVTSRAGPGGEGPAGKSVEGTTPCYYPTKAPHDIKAIWKVQNKAKRTFNLTVTWQAPARESWNCQTIKGYRVYIKDINLKKTINGDIKYSIFPDLQASTYRIQVTLINNDGFESVPSKELSVLAPETDPGAGGLTVGQTAGIVCAFVLLTALAVVMILFVLRRRRQDHAKALDPLPSFHSEELHLTENGSKSKEGAHDNTAMSKDSEDIYGNTGDARKRLLKLSEIGEYIKNMKGEEGAFKQEYEEIPTPETLSAVFGDKTDNQKKNRYKGIRPYDRNRVTLDNVEDDPDSDYVNASFIDSFNRSKAFIAAQGPKTNTVTDFWRMIWQYKIPTIVMLTKVNEGGRKKCEQYWPEENSDMFGDFHVQVKDKEKFSDYSTTSLKVTKGEERLMFKHYHFTSWPDHGVPDDGAAFYTFLQIVRKDHGARKEPILVHCSAGIGRTGTYIAMDCLLDQATQEGYVDVFSTVTKLRTQRISMVQTLEQYVFIYDTLYEIHMCGDPIIACTDFPATCSKLRIKNTTTGRNKLEDQLELIRSMRQPAKDKDCKGARAQENLHKNRDKSIIPADRCRPFLMTPMDNHNDYINAVFVDGYQKKDAYLVTQTPLEATIADLWRLMYDYKSNTIVALDDMKDENTEPYWPSTQSEYGSLIVSNAGSTDINGMVIREFQLYNSKKEGERRIVKQFHVTGWAAGDEVPESADLLVTLMDKIQKWQQHSGDGPITVHCRNGALQSGLYCAVTDVCNKISVEQQVDIYQTVKRLKKNRAHFVDSQVQYDFCYHMAQVYMDQFNTYANFR